MAESATRKAPGRGAASGRESFLPPLRVRYYKRMKKHGVYPVEVMWKEAERGVPGKEITLRLLVGGAQVVPVERTLNPADPEDTATFHITPLANGKLGNPHLEVLAQGRKVQEVPLPCRVVNPGRAVMLFVLALVIPWFLLQYCKNTPFANAREGVGKAFEKMIADNMPSVPAEVNDMMPGVESFLLDMRHYMGENYEYLCRICREQPIAFYVFCGFFTLALLSALLNRTGRRRLMGKPIPVPAGGAGRGDEE